MIDPKRDSGRSFRNAEFLRRLADAGGGHLVRVIGEHADLLEVIARLRNTIHGASLLGVRVNKLTAEAFHFEVPATIRPPLERLVEQTPGRDWGLRASALRPLLAPYVFADTAVREVFRLINLIAAATEVERLVAVDRLEGSPRTGPPARDPMFGEAMGRRFVAIGW